MKKMNPTVCLSGNRFVDKKETLVCWVNLLGKFIDIQRVYFLSFSHRHTWSWICEKQTQTTESLDFPLRKNKIVNKCSQIIAFVRVDWNDKKTALSFSFFPNIFIGFPTMYLCNLIQILFGQFILSDMECQCLKWIWNGVLWSNFSYVKLAVFFFLFLRKRIVHFKEKTFSVN